MDFLQLLRDAFYGASSDRRPGVASCRAALGGGQWSPIILFITGVLIKAAAAAVPGMANRSLRPDQISSAGGGALRPGSRERLRMTGGAFGKKRLRDTSRLPS